MSDYDLLRATTQRTIGASPAARRKYVTMQTSIREELHQFIRQKSVELNMSMAKVVELALVNMFKDEYKAKAKVRKELSDMFDLEDQ